MRTELELTRIYDITTANHGEITILKNKLLGQDVDFLVVHGLIFKGQGFPGTST